MVPGESDEAALGEIRDLMARARNEADTQAESVGFGSTTGPPAETPADAAIVRAAVAVANAHGVGASEPKGFLGAGDMVHFATVGADTVVMGPGDLGVAHKPDEFVPIDELVTASMIYRDLALAMFNAAYPA
jgi:acetylornithine deacetylase/succinyl-diaminopimelate desuccinylase